MSGRNGNGAPHAPTTAVTAAPRSNIKPRSPRKRPFRPSGPFRKEARDEIDRLIRFLNETDNHMEREPEDEGDDSDAEPSLGSFDRMADQSKAWRRTAGEQCTAQCPEVPPDHTGP